MKKDLFVINEQDKKIISWYKKLYQQYVLFFIFLVIILIGQIYLVGNILIPKCLEPFNEYLKFQLFIKTILIKFSGLGFIWVIFSFIILLTQMFSHKKIIKILDKINPSVSKNQV